MKIDYEIGRTNNYFESLVAGFTIGLSSLILIPFGIIILALSAVLFPIAGLFGFIKRK